MSASSTSQLSISSLAALFPPSSDYTKDFGWVAIAGAVLLGFGQEPLISQLGDVILQQTGDDQQKQLLAFRKLREALLKASPLVGFPRVSSVTDINLPLLHLSELGLELTCVKSINGLAALRTFLKEKAPTAAETLSNDKSMRDPVSLPERQKRGKSFFSKIYAQHTERVLGNLNASSGGDLGEFAINCIYGDLMAEERELNAKETGLMEFACCMTLAAAPQAKG